jgi:hypothetical protein
MFKELHRPMAVSPAVSAYMMQAFPLSVPIFIGGFLQLLHDCVFYYLFRRIRPPEERTGEPGSAAQ